MDEELPISPTTPPETTLADVEPVEPTAPEENLEMAEVGLPVDVASENERVTDGVASMSIENEGAVGGQEGAVGGDENLLPSDETVVVMIKGGERRPRRVKEQSEYIFVTSVSSLTQLLP